MSRFCCLAVSTSEKNYGRMYWSGTKSDGKKGFICWFADDDTDYVMCKDEQMLKEARERKAQWLAKQAQNGGGAQRTTSFNAKRQYMGDGRFDTQNFAQQAQAAATGESFSNVTKQLLTMTTKVDQLAADFKLMHSLVEEILQNQRAQLIAESAMADPDADQAS